MVISTSGKKVRMKLDTLLRPAVGVYPLPYHGRRYDLLPPHGLSRLGRRLDYIVCPGLDWAIEGFSLKNRHDTVWTGDFRETVIGTSLTAYF